MNCESVETSRLFAPLHLPEIVLQAQIRGPEEESLRRKGIRTARRLAFHIYEGIVPYHIPSGIKAAHESGIWTRWQILLSRSISNTDTIPFMHATMGGNVVLIFIVWSFGVVGAIVG